MLDVQNKYMIHKKTTVRPLCFLSAMLFICASILILLAVHEQDSRKTYKALESTSDQAAEVKGAIMHLDELLSMSARMAVATGDIRWQQQYEEFELQMQKAIAHARALSSGVYRTETTRMTGGQFHLLEMEHQALSLIRTGQSNEAMGILFGKTYEEAKRKYAKAMERLTGALKREIDSKVAAQQSRDDLRRLAFITVLILLLLSWLLMVRYARASQDALKETCELLTKHAQELDVLNRSLDEQVQERTVSLHNAQNQLFQAEKLAAVGQLAAGIAHEINNPIGVIHSNLQTLEQYVAHYTKLLAVINKMEKAIKDQDPVYAKEAMGSWSQIKSATNYDFINEDVGNLIKESSAGSEKISRIVHDLRAFASPDKGMMETVNIQALLDSMVNIAWNEIKYKASVQKAYENVSAIYCNPQKIGQVFMNLLLNAAQAINQKGLITIRTYEHNNHVCVDIVDTGCGIPLENSNNIFDPFFTTKPAGKGIGLGLSISYDIVRKHGGTITFISRPGKGTTFTVMLPMAAEHTGDAL